MILSSITHRRTSYPAAAILAASAVTMSLSGGPGASEEPIVHNARVAEYLLQHQGARYRNARVAEYLLAQHQVPGTAWVGERVGR